MRQLRWGAPLKWGGAVHLHTLHIPKATTEYRRVHFCDILPLFHVPFWLSHIPVYLFILLLSSSDRSKKLWLRQKRVMETGLIEEV